MSERTILVSFDARVQPTAMAKSLICDFCAFLLSFDQSFRALGEFLHSPAFDGCVDVVFTEASFRYDSYCSSASQKLTESGHV